MLLISFQRIQLSFLLDWFFVFLVTIGTGILSFVSPFERQFRIDDETISHPYVDDEMFSGLELALSGVVFPVLVISFYHLFNRDLKYAFHQAIMGICVSVTLCLFVTTLIKVSVGRFRPDFISRCQVNITKVEEIYKSYNISNQISFGPRNLYNTTICTNTNKFRLDEGRRSFPSGHTAFAFSSLTYTSLFLAGKLHLFDGNFILWKLIMVIIPNLLALFIGFTRLIDYRHHWQDVVVGGILGILFSSLSYFYYFPSLTSPEPHIPLQGRLRKYNVYQDHPGKTLPIFRDKNKNNEDYISLSLLSNEEEESKQSK
ncbi:acid phosphatase/Vanadium-dependent haloperoxidase [Anaeromyces robustus]|uniref:Acid phosphatase/Vanadium-dependent haloperoxidase n=1 Tax=Anaeromyces robustus TaxID=1754192 RepID=A0A1Y1W4M4_9FUNG|nr:acid phosphatase/Vanadium-dependent haloperoxidase [Anaeromyces robustus]|eukprot:ORX68447.1 acid phosphatase/Vanadium-dependent haloperoxidase [Anaeromyces robustus]